MAIGSLIPRKAARIALAGRFQKTRGSGALAILYLPPRSFSEKD